MFLKIMEQERAKLKPYLTLLLGLASMKSGDSITIFVKLSRQCVCAFLGVDKNYGRFITHIIQNAAQSAKSQDSIILNRLSYAVLGYRLNDQRTKGAR